jgi:hypothetical protein
VYYISTSSAYYAIVTVARVSKVNFLLTAKSNKQNDELAAQVELLEAQQEELLATQNEQSHMEASCKWSNTSWYVEKFDGVNPVTHHIRCLFIST